MTHDPIAPVILGVTGILFCAVIGRYVARKIGQPSVLGELLIGVAAGNLGYLLGLDLILILREGTEVFDLVSRSLSCDSLDTAALDSLRDCTVSKNIVEILHGPHGFDYLQIAHIVDVFSRYGVIFLLFLIGIDTSIKEMSEVRVSSVRVALIGVIMPFLLSFTALRVIQPGLAMNTVLFVSATLCATSVGITARVLKDLGLSGNRTAHVILGAAVLDDILGLVMLAVVAGITVSGGVVIADVFRIIALAVGFLMAAYWLSPYFVRMMVNIVQRLDLIEAKIFVSLIFVMSMAWLANVVGLSVIVGAFAAGVVLHDGYFKHWGDVEHHQFSIRDLIGPLEVILVPIFFILMGIQVKIETFFAWNVVGLTVALLGVAIIGKLLSGIGADKCSNRWAVGWGMLPRGEVGLVFASIGKGLNVINDALFAAIVLMVIITTLLTPFALKRVIAPQSSQPS